jgi:NAD+ kinase
VKIKGYPVRRVALYVKRELEGSKPIESLVKLLESKFKVELGLTKTRVRFGEGIVISVGGDGTFLAAARQTDPNTPILGVNMGRRGAMTDALPSDLPVIAERLSEGEYHIEERLRLRVVVGSEELSDSVINEVYVNRTYESVTPTYTVYVEGSKLYSERMDGVIVSTPTGSTGYNLSAGGPVLQELMSSVVVTPVLPIKRIPPVVAPLRDDTVIEVTSSHSTQILVDGRLSATRRQPAERITIGKSSKPLRIVRVSSEPYQHLRKTL